MFGHLTERCSTSSRHDAARRTPACCCQCCSLAQQWPSAGNISTAVQHRQFTALPGSSPCSSGGAACSGERGGGAILQPQRPAGAARHCRERLHRVAPSHPRRPQAREMQGVLHVYASAEEKLILEERGEALHTQIYIYIYLIIKGIVFPWYRPFSSAWFVRCCPMLIFVSSVALESV
jgi:hypothetical protein